MVFLSLLGRFQYTNVPFYNVFPRFHCLLVLSCSPIAYIDSLEGSKVTRTFHKFRNLDDYGTSLCLYSLTYSNVSIDRFIDDAYNEGIPVVILTSYCKSSDNIAR